MRSFMPGTRTTFPRSAGFTPTTRTGSRWAAKHTRAASRSKAHSRRSTRVGLARRRSRDGCLVLGHRSGNATVMFKWEITSDPKRTAEPRRGNTVLVVAKARDGWVIVAGQAAALPTLH